VNQPDMTEEWKLKKEEIGQLLGTYLPFYAELSPQHKETLCAASSGQTVYAGTHIHGFGARCTGIILVLEGCLRSYLLSEDGRDVTLYRIRKGSVCILSASCVLCAITFDVSIDAEEDSRILVIDPIPYNRISGIDVHMDLFNYKQAVARFSDVMWKMQQILFMKVDCRLADALLTLCKEQGSDTIRIKQETLARDIGTAREVVSRMLNYFESDRIIETGRGRIRILDRVRLEAAAQVR